MNCRLGPFLRAEHFRFIGSRKPETEVTSAKGIVEPSRGMLHRWRTCSFFQGMQLSCLIEGNSRLRLQEILVKNESDVNGSIINVVSFSIRIYPISVQIFVPSCPSPLLVSQASDLDRIKLYKTARCIFRSVSTAHDGCNRGRYILVIGK